MRCLESEPDSCWHVARVLRKRDVVVQMVASRAHKATLKCGIEMPTDVEHNKRIDTRNGNSFWINAVEKEANAIRMSFEILDK